jgi:hypothetical protein
MSRSLDESGPFDSKYSISEIVARINLRSVDYLRPHLFIFYRIVKDWSIEERAVSTRVSRRGILNRLRLLKSLRIIGLLPSPLQDILLS